MPADIERTSMQIISDELAQRGISLDPQNEAVVKRVIHTTADFDYAENLRFTLDAVRQGICALQRGTSIVTDTNMAKAGISKPSLRRLGCEAYCYMADPEIAARADRQGSTRAVAAMQYAAQAVSPLILAVGNAPTALLEIVRMMEEDAFRPALVIGVPVGFVNVEESKVLLMESCTKYGVPAIAAMGRKGGSTVAAAICNALLYTTLNTLDPEKRGWN